jgi:hypothetical protein
MHRILLPAMQALDFMCHELFPKEVLGNNVIAWHNLNVQTKRLDSDIIEQQIIANQCISTIDDVQKDENKQRSERVERGFLIMVLVRAIFSPLSFIVGMYGMNFSTPEGEPGIPELIWWPDADGNGVSGYAYFWILCGCCMVTTFTLYIFAGLIPNPVAGLFDGVIERFKKLPGDKDAEKTKADKPHKQRKQSIKYESHVAAVKTEETTSKAPVPLIASVDTNTFEAVNPN